MGTRSMIAIENPNSKSVKAVYCHWDGYLEHNGSILNKHYSNSPKVNNLIALGDLSSLLPEIGEKHLFSSLEIKDKAEREAYEKTVENMCTFYTRDRGEDAPYKFFPTIKEALGFYDGSWCEYFYLFKYDADMETGKWFYRTRENGRWKRLATAMKKFKEDEVA
jgi:hypothetical protein